MQVLPELSSRTIKALLDILTLLKTMSLIEGRTGMKSIPKRPLKKLESLLIFTLTRIH